MCPTSCERAFDAHAYWSSRLAGCSASKAEARERNRWASHLALGIFEPVAGTWCCIQISVAHSEGTAASPVIHGARHPPSPLGESCQERLVSDSLPISYGTYANARNIDKKDVPRDSESVNPITGSH